MSTTACKTARRYAYVVLLVGSAFAEPTVAQQQALADYTLHPGDQLEIGVWKEPDLTKAEDSWKDLNNKLVERAWIVPYGHRKLATFFSERMDFENCNRFHPVYFNDYSAFCLK